MRKFYLILFAVMMACLGCQWHLRGGDEDEDGTRVAVDRFDEVESAYLTMGDFTSLQLMNMEYPVETRMLIENVLQLGQVDESDIKVKFLLFFQDSTLQALIRDVEVAFIKTDDLDRQFSEAFSRLQQLIPDLKVPHIYTQIGSLDQSIIVGNDMLGISLDKYLGADYPLYIKYGYTEEQRRMMTRSYIVPDGLGFYLLSLYPMADDLGQEGRHQHMGRIQHTVNKALNRRLFTNAYVVAAEQYMAEHPQATFHDLLSE